MKKKQAQYFCRRRPNAENVSHQKRRCGQTIFLRIHKKIPCIQPVRLCKYILVFRVICLLRVKLGLLDQCYTDLQVVLSIFFQDLLDSFCSNINVNIYALDVLNCELFRKFFVFYEIGIFKYLILKELSQSCQEVFCTCVDSI